MVMDNQSTNTQLDEWVETLQPILRHINAHRFLWGFTFVCAFVAWNRGLLLLYGLVAVLLAVLIISYIFYVVNVKGLQISASFNQLQASVDENIDIQLNLTSQWRKHFLNITLHIQPMYLYFNQQLSANLFIISHKGEQHYTIQQSFNRGVYQLNNIQLTSAYPFGLLSAQRTFVSNDKLLYVLPKWFYLPTLSTANFSELSDFFQSNSSKNGHDDISDIRPYRRGDALKTIHWGASAKQVSRGKEWLVKTFTNQDLPSALIVLNPFDVAKIQPLTDKILDNMITIALSMGQMICRQGFAVTLVGFNQHQQMWHLPLTNALFSTDVPQNNQQLLSFHASVQDRLQILAEIQAINSTEIDYQQAIQQAQHQYPANILVSFGVEHSSIHVTNLTDVYHIHINFGQNLLNNQQEPNRQIFNIPFSTKSDDLPNYFLSK